MFRKTMIAPLLAASAMALTVTPAHAGKADRAREAIAAAEAKIHSAETMGAGSEMPREAADARASLALAKEKLASGDKSESIEEAIHAQQLADTAIGVMQHRQDQAKVDAASAQQQAAAANQRADIAQQQAANSAADAAAARNAAIAAQNQPAQVETTVTTQQPAPRASSRTAVRKTTTTKRTVVAPSTTTTTTTTVKQAVN